MPDEHVQLVRRAYEEGYSRRSVDPVRDITAAAFRFHMRPGFPGRPSYGADEMTDIWADLEDTFSEYSIAPEAFESLGRHVLVTLRQNARMRGSDAWIDNTVWHLWDVTGGILREAWTFDDRAEAVAAAAGR